MYTEKKTIFIDGSSGTAGLRIYDRLAQRADITLLTLPPELGHDIEAQREMLNRADIAFLCLPDAAAVTAADLVENPDTVVLDTSTAHRTAPGWVYGFPELSPEREAAIRTAKRIAVPGCHASGFVVLTYPLVEAGILPPDALLTCYSLTGYSGGGKKMIAEYEADEPDPLYAAPGSTVMMSTRSTIPMYGFTASAGVLGLSVTPVFLPSDFAISMALTMFSSVSASTWKFTRSAPALQNCSTYLTGRSIIRCTSMNMSVAFLNDFKTGMPIDIFGTKIPSITSKCT